MITQPMHRSSSDIEPGDHWCSRSCMSYLCVSKSPTQDSSYVTFQTRTLIIPLTWYYNSMNTCYIRPISEPDDWHSRFCIIIHIKIATFTFLLSSHRQSTVISISVYRSLTRGLTSVHRDVDPLNWNWGLFMPISKGSPNSVIWETPILGTICHWNGDFILELLIPLSILHMRFLSICLISCKRVVATNSLKGSTSHKSLTIELTHCKRYFDSDTEVDRMIRKILTIRVGASLSDKSCLSLVEN